MTLTIDRFVTRGKIPRKPKVESALVEQVAREKFPVECARQLRRLWPAQPTILRIRRLRVRLTIPAAQWAAENLAAAWTAAFMRELFAALANPNGSEIVRFESRAEYLASAIRDLLNGDTSQRWVYQEFERLFNLGTPEAAFAFLESESSEIVPALLILENWGLLNRLFALWDAVTLERLLFAIESTNNFQDENISIEDLMRVANLSLGRRSMLSGMDSSGGAKLGDRKLALNLFLAWASEADWRNARIPSPRKIFHALCLLDTLLDLHQSVVAARQQMPLADQTIVSTLFSELWEVVGSVTSSEARQNLLKAFGKIIATTASGSQAAIAELLGELITAISSETQRHQFTQLWNMIATEGRERRSALAELLGELTSIISSDSRRSQITEFWDILASGNRQDRAALALLFKELASATDSGTRQGQGTKFRWVSSECAGLFFLIRILDKLQWAARLGPLSFGAASGPRLLTYTLAGVASAILGRFDEVTAYLDPGLALFSGWVDAPELGGLRRFFASEPVQTRRDLLDKLLGSEANEEGSMNWEACFNLLANHLIREFAESIRGFGRSSRAFVVKNFLALPGRIRVEEARLSIVFTSCPLNAVIHLSRLDDPVEVVDWLGSRRIEFEPYEQ